MPVTATLRQFVARRLRFALSRFQDEIEEVTVRLSAENGPKGGSQRVCHVVATISSRTLLVRDADPDLHTAVSRAAERMGRAVSRELEGNRVLRQKELAPSTFRKRRNARQSNQEED